VSISSTTSDPIPGDHSATETTAVATSADVSITKSDGESNVTAGAATVHTYTIVVSNAGPSDATSVNVTDNWPAGFTRGVVTTSQGTCDTTTSTTNFTCSLGTIPAGGSATVTAKFTVPALTSGSQTNTATLVSPSDSTPGNNSASDTDTISTNPTVTINQAATQSDPTKVSPIHFTVVFSQSVTGFDPSDVVLGGSANPTTANVTGSGTTYDVAVSAMTSDGTVTASVKANAAMNTFGDGNAASTSTDNTVTYDTTGPATSNTAVTPSPTNVAPTITATETDA